MVQNIIKVKNRILQVTCKQVGRAEIQCRLGSTGDYQFVVIFRILNNKLVQSSVLGSLWEVTDENKYFGRIIFVLGVISKLKILN